MTRSTSASLSRKQASQSFSLEEALQQFAERNPFTFTSFPLDESIKDHPEIKQMVDAYKTKFPEKATSR